jgi:hypothetical protein
MERNQISQQSKFVSEPWWKPWTFRLFSSSELQSGGRAASLQMRFDRPGPQFVTGSIQMQTVFYEQFRTRFPIISQHGCENIQINQPFVFPALTFNQGIGCFHFFCQVPAFDARLDGDEDNSCFGQVVPNGFHKLLEIRSYLHGTFSGCNIVVTCI